MSPIQQMFLGAGGAVASKPYVDDVFSTYVYKGNGGSLSINNGIDASGEGAMTWIKMRTLNNKNHQLFDTERGVGKYLASDTYADEGTDNSKLSAFNNNGFTVGSDQLVNQNNENFVSWTFRKAKGAFTICKWEGDDSASRQISHDLGCQPGLIILKNRSRNGTNWMAWHKDFSATQFLEFNDTSAVSTDSTLFGGSGSTSPTSTNFTIGGGESANKDGDDFIAYVFAGGESTAATARSVEFDGSDDQLNIPDSTDWDLGNGDFTLETWIKSTQTTSGYFTALGQWTTHTSPDYGWAIRYASQDIGTGWSFFYSTTGSNYITTMGSDISDGQWHHIAITRTGGKLRTFTDGILNTTRSTTDTFTTSGTTMKIGGQDTSGNYFDGQLSNVRLVKGTALYTSSFRPPTEPLTNVTNTVLLCCNNSSVTGSTVTPGTITASSSPTASTDSPFDDPAAFTFGDAGDQGIVKCGSYIGNGSSTAGVEVNLGWEPQLIILKESSNAGNNWSIWDSMRGISTDDNDALLEPSDKSSEWNGANYLAVTPTGFKLESDTNNGDGKTMVYMAIRRPDGYVGKPPELGTDVFAMDSAGTGVNAIPAYDSGFPVDFVLEKNPTGTTWGWFASSRLTGNHYWYADKNNAETSGAGDYVWDSNVGAIKGNWTSPFMAWMWKRHAGFDVVTYKGNNVAGLQIPHSLNAVPEMMWVKNRGASEHWAVYHKGLNGGTNPEQYFIKLDEYESEYGSNNGMWNSTAPTSTHFTLGSWDEMNADDGNHVAMLFASVSGISSIGSYAGSDSSVTVNCGFQPRFVIIKENTATRQWVTFDTVRGIQSPGVDQQLYLSANYAQDDDQDYLDISSTGFTVKTNSTNVNQGSQRYIYYAHA